MANIDRILPIIAPVLRGMLQKSQAMRLAQFAAAPVADRVVFLGDSITEQGVWEQWFPELPTLNRGIGGNAIYQVLERLDNAIVSPRAISLLIGTNDLHGLGRSADVGEIATEMRDLVRRIREKAPTAPLLVNSVLPRSAYFAARIRSLNARYRQVSIDEGAAYVDVWPALAGPDGAIRRAYTSDGLHLSGEGYRAWAEVLRPHLSSFATSTKVVD